MAGNCLACAVIARSEGEFTPTALPTAICMWPKDLVIAPREWAERFYNVRRYSSRKHGGHFPAWEAPDAFASDIRLFTRSLNIG